MEDGKRKRKFSFFVQDAKDNTKSRTKSGDGVEPAFKLFSDEAMENIINIGKTHRYVWVCVTGYDSSLVEDDALKKDLTDIFRSCGPILRVDFGKDPESDQRCAFVKVYGERVDEKASLLSGTEFRGRKLVAKTLPPVEPIFKQHRFPFPPHISDDGLTSSDDEEEEEYGPLV